MRQERGEHHCETAFLLANEHILDPWILLFGSYNYYNRKFLKKVFTEGVTEQKSQGMFSH